MWIKRLIAVGLFLALIFLGWREIDIFRIQEIRVVESLDSVDLSLFQKINEELGPQLQKFKGRFIWQVSLPEVLESLDKDARIQTARIERELPDLLKVIVEPRKPVLNLVDHKGRIYPVAVDGRLLPQVKASEARDLPLLRGRALVKEEGLRLKAIELIQSLSDKGEFIPKNISELGFAPKEGFVIHLVDSGTIVRIGQDQFAYKAGLVERVLGYLNSRQLSGRVIDARFEKKVMVKLKNEP